MRRNLFLKAYLLSLVILAGGLTEVAWSEHGSNSAETITASWFDNVTDLVPSIDDYDGSHSNLQGCNCAGQWRWQLLPDGLIYHSYLAGVKEPRFAGNWMNEDNLGDLWDVSLGGRFPLVRYGSCSLGYPQGWQVDMEGGVMPRLSRDDDLDLISADYRFGIPVTYGCGNTQYKLAYYHLSSHMGDEYLEANPEAQRINYSRDALVLGISHYLRPSFRVYGETGFGMETDGGSQPWEFQFGAEFAPACATGFRGAPFVAANAHLREEVDYGGEGVFQAGWAWRGGRTRNLFRAGLQYYNGKSPQYQFFDESEQQIGFALWYDY